MTESSEPFMSAVFILLPIQVFVLPVLSISIAAIWGVSAKDKLFHFAVKVGYGRKQVNFAKAVITLFYDFYVLSLCFSKKAKSCSSLGLL